jgi:hypothetical protein
MDLCSAIVTRSEAHCYPLRGLQRVTMDLCTIVTRYALCRGQQWFGAGYHMIYAPADYVGTFAWLYSYDKSVTHLFVRQLWEKVCQQFSCKNVMVETYFKTGFSNR